MVEEGIEVKQAMVCLKLPDLAKGSTTFYAFYSNSPLISAVCFDDNDKNDNLRCH